MGVISKTIVLKALTGERVYVKNYRLKDQSFEYGEVINVETHWRKDGSYWNSYRILLDRKSKTGNVLIITVGDEDIADSN